MNGSIPIVGKAVVARVDEIRPNGWNPNRMAPEVFEREKRSIQANGFFDPILVREHPEGGYEIIDGEHRWRAAGALGMKAIPAVNLGRVSDAKARKLTALTMELKGAAKPDLFAQLLKALVAEESVDALAEDLPISSMEIDLLIHSTDAEDLAFTPPATTPRPREAAEEKRFALGNLRVKIPAWLIDELASEYKATGERLRTGNPEVIVRDWLTRLGRAAPAAASPPRTGLQLPEEDDL